MERSQFIKPCRIFFHVIFSIKGVRQKRGGRESDLSTRRGVEDRSTARSGGRGSVFAGELKAQ